MRCAVHDCLFLCSLLCCSMCCILYLVLCSLFSVSVFCSVLYQVLRWWILLYSVFCAYICLQWYVLRIVLFLYVCMCVCVWGIRLRSVELNPIPPLYGYLCGYMVRIIKAKKTQPLIKLKPIWFSKFLLCFKIMLIFSEKVSIKWNVLPDVEYFH